MTPEPFDIQALREALEESTVAVLLVDRDLKLTFVNRTARELFDLQADNWQGRSVLDLTPENRRDLFVRLLAAGPGLLGVWETLDETGALDLVLPEWERVRLLPHASAAHRFTVDRHLVETCI